MAYIMKMHFKKGKRIGRYKIKVYDRPKFNDRYTIAMDGGKNGDRHVLAANSMPFHPSHGIGQYVGVLYYEDYDNGEGQMRRHYGYDPVNFGRLISWDSLPDDVKKFVENWARDDESPVNNEPEYDANAARQHREMPDGDEGDDDEIFPCDTCDEMFREHELFFVDGDDDHRFCKYCLADAGPR